MDWVDKPQNYKDLYGILQLLRFSHLNNFQLETLKLGWVAFHSVKFQLKCLDFQSNQYKKLVPVLSRFCNGLCPRPGPRTRTARSGVERTNHEATATIIYFNLKSLFNWSVKENFNWSVKELPLFGGSSNNDLPNVFQRNFLAKCFSEQQ